MTINSYPSIYNFGHKALEDFFGDPIIVEEKVDGSQFSFGVIDGVLFARSKNAQIDIDAPAGMFQKGIDTIIKLKAVLTPGYVYRGEYLSKEKHNTLKYDQVPIGNIIIFDISTGTEDYLSPFQKADEANRIGLECVPAFLVENVGSVEQLKELCARESCLGGPHMEGVVLKNYYKFGPDKKVLMAKYVREEFKEQHRTSWKASNPSKSDIVERLIETYKVDARWNKAVQHLRDAGNLDGAPTDIGPLMKEVTTDILKEHEDEIKEELFKLAWPKISRGVVKGLPQWYKDKLATEMFEAVSE